MKKNISVLIAIILFSIVVIACENENPVDNSSEIYPSAETFSYQTLSTMASGDLNPAIIEALKFMREEEKLARDVYTMMYKKHGLRSFANITQSEQMHTDAIKSLLIKYVIEDPVKKDEIGLFTNQDLQKLYNKLIAAGNVSQIEALKVGAAIEEIDILDLQKHLAELNNNDDIKYVYENLKNASGNHINAFVSNLARRGITYSPIYMDLTTYNSFLR